MPCFRPILLAAALGIATTLGIAWAIAAWMPFESYPRQSASYFVAGSRPWSAWGRASRGVQSIWWDEIDADSYTAPRQPPSTSAWPSTPEAWVEFARARHEAMQRHGSGSSHASFPRRPPASAEAPMWGTFAGGSAPDVARAGQDCAFGWPFPALWYQVPGTIAANTATASGIRGGVMLTPQTSLEIRGYDFRALPLRPVWWGLAGNGLLFSALWWTALVGPRAVRAALRARAGRCPNCGYARGGIPPGSPCPECGRREPQAGG